MALEKFIDVKFAAKTLAMIDQANDILTEYEADGLTLTLRQLYYQFVSRDLLANKQSEYKRLGSIINEARQAGLIDWSMIEDRTRNLQTHSFWNSPASIIRSAAQSYAENLWKSQDVRVEVWIEKDALVGVIERICNERRVPYFACRGNTSQSETYSAGLRYREYIADGLRPIVLHLGDHDPNGIDMTRDNRERLTMFAQDDVEVRRLALNMDQVRRYNPPPNPVKFTDSRSGGYVKKFGKQSWELDALEPRVIEKLIADELDGLIDPDAWDEALAKEKAQKKTLATAAQRWPDVQEFLGKTPNDEDDDAADDGEE